MTEDDYLTLTLGERIAWLHGDDGPEGKLSHDKFAERLGTSRQTVISWEKDGVEPKGKLRAALAEFSGRPEAMFSRREAEALVREMIVRRLERLEDEAEGTTVTLEGILSALAEAQIPVRLPEAARQSAPTAPRGKRR